VREVREPAQDRSRATRRRLLEAAVACLSELGWSGSTVAVVAERAGVSRGATQHHFPNREDLFTAAIEHVADTRVAALREAGTRLPHGPARTEAVVEMIVGLYTGPSFRAALQLWVRASTDERLRGRVVPLEEHVGRVAHQATLDALDADEQRPGVRRAVQATLDLARGLGLADLLTDDAPRRARIVHAWAGMLDTALTAETTEATA
jgi:AcrR family transcriptional regulator